MGTVKGSNTLKLLDVCVIYLVIELIIMLTS